MSDSEDDYTPPSNSKITRAWIFTINNPTADDFPEFDERKVSYAIWQLERGKKKRTPHYQGYVRFHNPVRFTALKKLMPRARLFAAARGGMDFSNEQYCSKNDDRIDGPWTIGHPTQQGKRSDCHEMLEMAKARAPKREFAEKFPGQFMRMYKGIAEMRSLFMPSREKMPTTIVIYGAPGFGKTHFARDWLMEMVPDCKPYQKPPNTKWWDMYDFQKSILIDEFNGAMPFTDVKLLLDKYDYIVEYKGSSITIPAEYIAITSNYHPNTWYDWSAHPIEALTRRVTEWYFFSGFKEYSKYTDYEEFCKGVMMYDRSPKKKNIL